MSNKQCFKSPEKGRFETPYPAFFTNSASNLDSHLHPPREFFLNLILLSCDYSIG